MSTRQNSSIFGLSHANYTCFPWLTIIKTLFTRIHNSVDLMKLVTNPLNPQYLLDYFHFQMTLIILLQDSFSDCAWDCWRLIHLCTCWERWQTCFCRDNEWKNFFFLWWSWKKTQFKETKVNASSWGQIEFLSQSFLEWNFLRHIKFRIQWHERAAGIDLRGPTREENFHIINQKQLKIGSGNRKWASQ